MKRTFFLIILFVLVCTSRGQVFEQFFRDSTLRVDYIFAGDNRSQQIYYHEATQFPGWAGRKHRLSEKFLNGNGQIMVKDVHSGQVIYVNTFSALFLEWQTEEEATKVKKAFENSLLIPFPKREVEVTVTLTDTHQKVSAQLTHKISPDDILIKKVNAPLYPYHYLLKSGDKSDCVDIAIISEGYSEDEMDKFHADCERTIDALFSHEPFLQLKPKFNVIAVDCPSKASGPSIPRKNIWNNLPSGTHYDTFYSDRYLMTSKMWQVYDILNNIPFEQIIILVNTDLYGGGGIFNQINVFPADHPTFKPLLVHEFGHGYAGLGDEYFYDDGFETRYPSDCEPWEPNLTTLFDFDSKWKDMLEDETPIPTEELNVKHIPYFQRMQLKTLTQKVGVYEGGGYQSKGVYRPAQECRMKVLEVEDFCPVCSRAIKNITEFYTLE